MSIASSPDYMSRPEDKALQMLFPAVDDGNNFDDFFNEELYGLTPGDDCKDSLDDLFSGVPFASDYPRLLSLSGSTSQEQSPPQPWRKGLWCLSQAQPARLSVEKTRKPGTGTISTAHLVNNDNFALRGSRSPAGSPTVNSTKKFAANPNAATYRHKAHPPIPISREGTLSLSPMYAQLPLHAKMEQVETWQEDFQNFHLRMSQQSSSASPMSPSRMRNALATKQVNAAMVAQNSGIGMALSTYDELPTLSGSDSDSRHALDPSLHIGFGMNSLSGPTNQAPVQHNLQEPHATSVWTTESLHSSNSSHQSYETMPQSIHSGQSSHSTHEVFPGQMQNWWSPQVGARNPTWDSPRQNYYSGIAAPAPQRPPAPALVQNLDQPSGLGIQGPELEQMDQAVYHDKQHFYSHISTGPAMSLSLSTGVAGHGIPPMPAFPVPTSHGLSNPSPFTTPRKQRRSPSRSPSLSLSPTSTTTRVLRQRSPTRTDHPHSHHRRKSIYKSGPMRDNPGEPTPSGSVRARSRSSSKPLKTPRTPKTPTGGFGAIDFVNFTPKDSVKLLSDVAPSGSSKTRARREAEAREKRKKLSEAALKAVSSAGGDVEALKKAILT